MSKEEYEAVKVAEKGVKDKKTSKRLRILMLRYEGYKVADIAKMYGTRKEWISQVCRKYLFKRGCLAVRQPLFAQPD